MCCDATHVVKRGRSRSYLACCACISAWQKCPIESMEKESGWLRWGATEVRTHSFFQTPKRAGAFFEIGQKNGTHFCVSMGGSRGTTNKKNKKQKTKLNKKNKNNNKNKTKKTNRTRKTMRTRRTRSKTRTRTTTRTKNTKKIIKSRAKRKTQPQKQN